MAKTDKKPAKTGKTSAGSEISEKFKRNPGLYIGSVVILVLVIVAFLGGDLLTPSQNAREAIFGYYDKTPVRLAGGNYMYNVSRMIMQEYQYQGADLSNSWIMYQVYQQAYQAAVIHNAYLQIMKRSNYTIPDYLVTRKVAQHPDLLENGVFSPVLYNQLSQTEKQNLWRQTQESLIKGVFIDDFFDGLLMTNAEAEFIGKMAASERSFNVVLFNVDDYPEAEYAAYARQNSRLFDTVHLSKITIASSERDAKKILDSINSGVISFEEAARTRSQDDLAAKGGDMGVLFAYDIEREITSAGNQAVLYGLKKGDISPVLSVTNALSENIWVIFRAEDDLKKADFEDEAVMETVRSYLRSYDRVKMEDWAFNQANDFISAVKDLGFEEAAEEKELQVEFLGPLPLNYGGADLFTGLRSFYISGFSDIDMDNLSTNENFWKIAFTTKINSASEPFVQGNNVLVLYPVEEIDVSATKAMDSASAYLTYKEREITEQSILSYFFNNPRMDDKFSEVYFREMMP